MLLRFLIFYFNCTVGSTSCFLFISNAFFRDFIYVESYLPKLEALFTADDIEGFLNALHF